MRFSYVLALTGSLVYASKQGHAKGLETLSEKAPDGTESHDSGEKSAESDGGSDSESAVDGDAKVEAKAQGAVSKNAAQKLFIGTSVGWVKASKASGSWMGSGMSDLTLGYKLASLGSKVAVAGTYRYAPTAVSGTEDSHAYRGVWEAHYLGARFNYALTSLVQVIGTGEAGYAAAHVHDVDGLPAEGKAAGGGGMLAIGTGADFALFEKTINAGPRLVAGFGKFTTVQLAASANFLF